MFDRTESICMGLGLLVRVLLFFQSRIRQYFEESGEFSTPLTSWKRGETNALLLLLRPMTVF